MQLRSGFAMHPNRLMFAIGLAVLALSVPGTSFAGGTADPAGAELRALDGLQFRAGIVRADKGDNAQPLEDTLIFNDGKFISKICERFNFQPAPYWVRSDGDHVHFRAELSSPTDGTMIWEGELNQDRLQGTMHWIKKRWYWTIDVAHTITGVANGTGKTSAGTAQ
ncbi:MAG: hypothetical protein KDE55_20650 [Novosphingobium sp.]|nr:hypothetical protein [Novosphingobium sp.]